jgi:hypothetical protein
MGTATLVLLLTLGTAVGQSDGPTYTMRERHILIPIKVHPDKRGDLAELLLFASKDQGKNWTMAGQARPDEAAFRFHAPSDGEFWFKVCAVDRAGQRDPADVYAAPVSMKVMIDTQQALLRIVSAERVGDHIHVVWETAGTQADLMTLKLEHRASDQGPAAPWQTVAISPAAHGQTRFRAPSPGPLNLRMTVNDQAGTPTTVVRDLAAAAAPAPAFAPISTNPAVSNPITTPAPAAVIQQANSISPPPPTSPPLANAANSAPAPVIPADVPAPAAMPVSPPPAPPVPTQAPPTPMPAAPTEPNGGGLTPLPTAKPGPAPAYQSGPPAGSHSPNGGLEPVEPAQSQMNNVQYVRDAQVLLDFELDRRGPSGVRRIEVFLTRDNGQWWHKYTETYDTKSPLQLRLPADEGLYGFRLVAHSGANMSTGPPQPGDEPDIRLCVDRTVPEVELYAPVPDPNLPNAVTLRYKAVDANLPPTGVTLQWSAQPSGPWQPISPGNTRSMTGVNVPGVKECTWVLPPELPDRVHLKVTAKDLAENVGEKVTSAPVTVDLNKPTARIRGIVSPGTRRDAAPPPFGGPQP